MFPLFLYLSNKSRSVLWSFKKNMVMCSCSSSALVAVKGIGEASRCCSFLETNLC